MHERGGLHGQADELLDQGVIDELVFWIYPATAGQGARPFEAATKVRLELMESKEFDWA
jgi:hypothetical protein